MRMGLSAIVIVLCASAHAAELQQLEKGRPTSRPAITLASTAAPSVSSSDVRLSLKDGAPPEVQKWFDDLPQLRAARVAEIEELMAVEKQRVLAMRQPASPRGYRAGGALTLEDQLAEEERNLAQIINTPLHKTNHGYAGSETSSNAAAQKRLAMSASRKRIGDLKRAIKERDKLSEEMLGEYERRIERIKNDPLYFDMPQLKPVALSVGKYGYLDSSLKVVQVVDKANLIVEIEEVNLDVGATDSRVVKRERLVWLEGFDTSNVVDDDILHAPMPIIFHGTKEYESRFGKRKVLRAVPLNVVDWLTVEPLKPMKTIPSIKMGGGIA